MSNRCLLALVAAPLLLTAACSHRGPTYSGAIPRDSRGQAIIAELPPAPPAAAPR